MRAANAMLRALGGDEIVLVLPLPASSSDISAQIGLADPGVQQVRLAPVVVRTLPAPAPGPAQRLELLVSVSAVASAVEEQGLTSAEALFNAAMGIEHQGTLFRVESTGADYFAGVPYLYRVIVVE
ncbi:MAG TPA: hypothetical protein VFM77_15740 [Terriglobales bacterium]|nr:hypothetical protein [Terriglobales bacterium]